ncbi:MAG: sodium/solute symporter [Akkermansiaceae bacterium]|nr:sodium/solute symporter [Akkermansiaceae bacterium]
MQISILDWIVIIAYLAGVVGLGCWAGMNTRKKGKQKGDSVAGEYFMAAHTLKWPVIGLALFATNISCVHLVSLAQSGYDTGLLNGNFEWMAAFTLILLGFFFAPFYLKSKVATLPDFLEKRYCRECRDLLAVVSIVAAIIFHIAFPLATGWLILHDIFGIEKWTCIFLMCALTGIYTVVGGLAAVAITETIQTIVLLAGAFVITWFAWHKTGGWEGMTTTLDTANAAAQGLTDGKLMSMLRPHGDDSGMPWYSILLGYPVLGIWYWCADQTIVQRVLGAKSENDARVGSIFCGIIKILPVFIFIVPGLMLYTAVKQGNLEGVTQVRLIQTVDKEKIIAVTGDFGGAKIDPIRLKEGETLDLSTLPITPKGKDASLIIGPDIPVKTIKTAAGETIPAPAGIRPYRSKEVYAVMIKKLLPMGVLGLLAAALMAALMGNLSSASNSIATMVSYDIVKRFRPATSDKQLVRIGRIATIASIAFGIALVPLLDRKASIFNALNEIIAHMAPPITCVFLLGVFWPAASARGAKWTMWLGSILGVGIYALKALNEGFPATFAWVPAFFIKTPFMMMAFYMFVACLVLQIVFTKLQPKLAGEDVQALYWPHPLDALKAPGWPGILNYKVLAGIVIVAMLILYTVFR